MHLVGMARCSKWCVDIFNNFTIYVFFRFEGWMFKEGPPSHPTYGNTKFQDW